MGKKDTAVARRGAAWRTQGPRGPVRGGRATGARQGEGRGGEHGGGDTSEGRPPGMAKDRQGESPTGARGPEMRPKRSRNNRRPVQQCHACMQEGGQKRKKQKQEDRPNEKKVHRPRHSRGHTEGAGGGGDGQRGAHKGKKDPIKKPQSEKSTEAGVQIGVTCAGGTEQSFRPAPLGCWRPGGV